MLKKDMHKKSDKELSNEEKKKNHIRHFGIPLFERHSHCLILKNCSQMFSQKFLFHQCRLTILWFLE